MTVIALCMSISPGAHASSGSAQEETTATSGSVELVCQSMTRLRVSTCAPWEKVSARDGDGAKRGKQQVKGTVLLPGIGADPAGCDVKPARRMWSLGLGNGIAGYAFDVDRATWGRKFDLRPETSLFANVDLDITFYYDFPTREEALADPISGGSAAYEHIETRQAGGEKGVVRRGAVVAIVCIYGGPHVTGAATPFLYTAG